MKFDEYYNAFLLLEADSAKRQAYLENKYGKTLHDLLVKTYEKAHNSDWYLTFLTKTIADRPIMQFIVELTDPTGGEYSEWIVKNLIKDISSGKMQTPELQRFFTEDYFKLKDDLEKYHKYKKLFKKASVDMNNPETAKLTDINRIKGFDELYRMLQIIQHYIETQENAEEAARAEKESEKIYTSDNYIVLIPKTQEASCAYGRGTRWCTASTGSRNYFDQYNRQGPLYVIINRKTQDKFQFHFESGQFMDSDDNSVNIPAFFKSNAELKNVFLDIAIAKDNWYFIEKMGIDSEVLVEKVDILPEDKKKRVIGTYIPVAFSYGLKNPKFVNENQKLMVFEDNDTITLVTPYKEFSDLSMFIGQNNSKYYESVLSGDEDFWGSAEYITYDSDYLEWIDEKNLKKIKEYVRRVTGEKVSNAEEALETLENEDANGWMEGWITEAYKEVYESEYKDAVQNYYIKIISKTLGEKYQWNDEDCITFRGWQKNKFKSDIIDYILMHPMNENDEFPAYKNFFREFAEILHNEGELNEPDESGIYPDLDYNDENQKDIFNYRLSDVIDMPPDNDPQIELGLEIDESQVNRNMLQFDLYVKKILSEDLGNRGPAVKAQAPQTMGTSSTPQAPTSPTTPQQGSAPTSPQPTSGVQTQQNQQPDYLTIFSNPESMQQFSSDPNNVQRFKTFLSDPKNVQTLTSQIKDPNVMASMIGLLSK
jgi:hypothetical protein